MFSESSFLVSILNYLYHPKGSVPCNYTNKVLDLLVSTHCNWGSGQLVMHISHVYWDRDHQQLLPLVSLPTHQGLILSRDGEAFWCRVQIFKTMVAPCCCCCSQVPSDASQVLVPAVCHCQELSPCSQHQGGKSFIR